MELWLVTFRMWRCFPLWNGFDGKQGRMLPCLGGSVKAKFLKVQWAATFLTKLRKKDIIYQQSSEKRMSFQGFLSYLCLFNWNWTCPECTILKILKYCATAVSDGHWSWSSYKIHIKKIWTEKCLKDPTYAIFLKSWGFKDVKYDILMCQSHSTRPQPIQLVPTMQKKICSCWCSFFM